jgi:putative endonuclease
MAHWVYILQSESTGRYYVGQTRDLAERLARHTAGRTAANRGRGPWRVGYHQEFPTRQAAVARERQLKARKSREYLAALCAERRVG